MGFPNNVYATAYNRMKDWLIESNSGGAVTDLARDLLNRAQEELRMYRMWEELSKREALTVNAQKVAFLPDDCGEVLGIYHDSDGDGRPDYWYWNRSKRPDDGYFSINDFDRLGGYQRSFQFYNAPSHTPILWYVRTLEEFEGTGLASDDKEYSFFPLDLLLVTAQVIHRGEEDVVDGSIGVLQARKNQLLTDYEEAHQWINTDLRMDVNDVDGNEVIIEEYSLLGTGHQNLSRYDNDQDYRGLGN